MFIPKTRTFLAPVRPIFKRLGLPSIPRIAQRRILSAQKAMSANLPNLGIPVALTLSAFATKPIFAQASSGSWGIGHWILAVGLLITGAAMGLFYWVMRQKDKNYFKIVESIPTLIHNMDMNLPDDTETHLVETKRRFQRALRNRADFFNRGRYQKLGFVLKYIHGADTWALRRAAQNFLYLFCLRRDTRIIFFPPGKLNELKGLLREAGVLDLKKGPVMNDYAVKAAKFLKEANAEPEAYDG